MTIAEEKEAYRAELEELIREAGGDDKARSIVMRAAAIGFSVGVDHVSELECGTGESFQYELDRKFAWDEYTGLALTQAGEKT